MSTQPHSAPQSQERGAKVIRLAVRIMAAGKARGWSDALSQAEKQVK